MDTDLSIISLLVLLPFCRWKLFML